MNDNRHQKYGGFQALWESAGNTNGNSKQETHKNKTASNHIKKRTKKDIPQKQFIFKKKRQQQ